MSKYLPTVMSHPVRKEPNRAMNAAGEWPDDIMVEFHKLMLTSMSYREVAVELSAMFPDNPKTRNAVLGKASRMGMRGTKPSPPNPRARTPEGRAGKKIARTRRYAKPEMQPIVYADPAGLRSESDAAIQPKARRAVSPADIAKRRLGHLSNIVEKNPLTSRPVQDCERGVCMWPTSEDARCMEVCGSPATIGAYCERHAQVAYRVMPTKKRNRSFNKDDREYLAGKSAHLMIVDEVGLGECKIDTGANDAAWIAANVTDDLDA